MIVRTSIMATDQRAGMDPGVSRVRAIRMIPRDAATRVAETRVRAIQAAVVGAIVVAEVTAEEEMEVGAVEIERMCAVRTVNKFLVCCVVSVICWAGQSFVLAAEPDPMEFWSVQRRGANGGNRTSGTEYFAAARSAGIEFVRLSMNVLPTDGRDPVVGSADQFEGIPDRDFAALRTMLDAAEEAGVKIVLTTSTLPGHRWRQANDGKDDRRLWRNEEFQEQAARFWKDLARRLANHRAVVGLNLLNEPHPERVFGIDDARDLDWTKWYQGIEGTAADLNRFHAKVAAAIREVDSSTPIIVDSGHYACVPAFAYLKPLADERTLYSFHFYDPYPYTTKEINKGRFKYPGVIEEFEGAGGRVSWDRERIEQVLKPIVDWQARHRISSQRILVGEFGVNRKCDGAADYLRDVIAAWEKNHWHWAFYAFREEFWPGMDYELGQYSLTDVQWSAIERRESLNLPRHDNPLWQVIQDGLRK